MIFNDADYWRDKIASKIAVEGDCWAWQGVTNGKGYGVIYTARYGARGRYFAHRVSWAIANRRNPVPLLVLHHCDNPPCVNPAHLYLGTALDNAKDIKRRKL